MRALGQVVVLSDVPHANCRVVRARNNSIGVELNARNATGMTLEGTDHASANFSNFRDLSF